MRSREAFVTVAMLSALFVAGYATQVLAQDPAELYQLLEDAKWLKEQGKIEEARQKLAEYDERLRGWRELERQRAELGEDWLAQLVQWAAEVNISEGLETVEREFDEGKLVVATLRLLSLRERIPGGIHLGRAQCLYGKLMLADKDKPALREMADKLGGPCALGAVLWPGGKGGPSASERGPSVQATIDTRMTESNESWQRWSWQVEARNLTSELQVFSLEVRWLDAGGFVIDDDREYGLRLGPGESKTFTGYQLIRQPGAGNVVSATVEVEVAQ